MIRLDHEQVAELLGVYALDAVDPDEAAGIEEHLGDCIRCSTELEGLREVTGLIANSGGDAPPALWDAISAQIEHPAADEGTPAVRHIFAKADTARSAPRSRRRLVRNPWILGAVAAGLFVVAGLGIQVGRLDNRVNQLQASNANQAVSQAAAQALSDSQAQRITLQAAHTSGPAVAQIAVLPTGTAFLVNHRLPPLASDQTYQLWGQVNQELISLGVLGPAPRYVSFHVGTNATISSFAITAEHAGGVVRTANVPVAVSTTGA